MAIRAVLMQQISSRPLQVPGCPILRQPRRPKPGQGRAQGKSEDRAAPSGAVTCPMLLGRLASPHVVLAQGALAVVPGLRKTHVPAGGQTRAKDEKVALCVPVCGASIIAAGNTPDRGNV